MALVQKNINWKPYEVIYSAGEEPNGVYLIKEGTVELYTPEGLKLNEISDKMFTNKIFLYFIIFFYLYIFQNGYSVFKNIISILIS